MQRQPAGCGYLEASTQCAHPSWRNIFKEYVKGGKRTGGILIGPLKVSSAQMDKIEQKLQKYLKETVL